MKKILSIFFVVCLVAATLCVSSFADADVIDLGEIEEVTEQVAAADGQEEAPVQETVAAAAVDGDAGLSAHIKATKGVYNGKSHLQGLYSVSFDGLDVATGYVTEILKHNGSDYTIPVKDIVDAGSYKISVSYGGQVDYVLYTVEPATITYNVVAKGGLLEKKNEAAVYDGDYTVQVTINNWGLTTADGVAEGDDVHLQVNQNGSAKFNFEGYFVTKNVADSVEIKTQNNLKFYAADATGEINNNYKVVLVGAIQPMVINFTGLVAADKIYDGTTKATVGFEKTACTIKGVKGETVSFCYPCGGSGNVAGKDCWVASFDSENAGSFATKNAGKDVVVTIDTKKAYLTVAGDTDGTTDGGNYTFTVNEAKATITPYTLKGADVAAFTASDKVYDGSVSADGCAVTLKLFGEDDVTVPADSIDAGFTASSGREAKDVGENINVLLRSFNIEGADAANYTVSTNMQDFLQNAPVAKASITQKEVTFTKYTADSTKVYDGNDEGCFYILNADLTPEGAVANDDVRVSAPATLEAGTWNCDAKYNSKNVSEAESISVTVALDGADAKNYKFKAGEKQAVSESGALVLTEAASITKCDVNFNVLVADKVYDGTTAATVGFPVKDVIVEKVAGEQVQINYLCLGTAKVDGVDCYYNTNGVFTDKNVGKDKEIKALEGITFLFNTVANDKGLDNYNITVTYGKADVTAKPVNIVELYVADKTFEKGNKDAVITGGEFEEGAIAAGDDVAISGTGSFRNDKVGEDKYVTVNTASIKLSGADAANYQIADVENHAFGNIVPAPVDPEPSDKGSDKGETKKEEPKQEETDKNSDKGETKQEEPKQEETDKGTTDKGETKQEETKQEETKQEETKQEETDKGTTDKGTTQKADSAKADSKKGAPDTGDNSNIVLWASILTVSAIACGAVLTKKFN